METASYILIAIGGLTALAGFVVVLMVAFRMSVAWGLTVLFLSWLVVPLVVFLVKYWPEARAGFLLSISGWVVSGVGSFMLAGSVATTAVAEFGGYGPQPRHEAELIRPEPAPEAELPDAHPPNDETVPTAPPSPLPSPTPTLAAETSAVAHAASPTPPVIPFEEAGDHVGETVLLALADGTSRRVVIDAVEPDVLRVTQQVGGGAMTYPIKWDLIVEIRPLS